MLVSGECSQKFNPSALYSGFNFRGPLKGADEVSDGTQLLFVAKQLVHAGRKGETRDGVGLCSSGILQLLFDFPFALLGVGVGELGSGRAGSTVGFDGFHHGDQEGVGSVHEFAIGPVPFAAPFRKFGGGSPDFLCSSGGSGVGSLVSNGVVGRGQAGFDVGKGGMAFYPTKEGGVGSTVNDGMPHGFP